MIPPDFVLQSFASKEKNKGYRENSNFESDVFNLDLTYLKDTINRYFTKILYSEQITEIPGNITLDDFYIRPRYSRTPEDFGTEKVNSISLGSHNLLSSDMKMIIINNRTCCYLYLKLNMLINHFQLHILNLINILMNN